MPCARRQTVSYSASRSVTFLVPVKTVSLNQWSTWRTNHGRSLAQHEAVRRAWLRNGVSAACKDMALPLRITMTRLSAGTLDTDNLAGSAKHVRDALAYWCGLHLGLRYKGKPGMDDNDPRLTWVCEQRRVKSGTYGVEVMIEW